MPLTQLPQRLNFLLIFHHLRRRAESHSGLIQRRKAVLLDFRVPYTGQAHDGMPSQAVHLPALHGTVEIDILSIPHNGDRQAIGTAVLCHHGKKRILALVHHVPGKFRGHLPILPPHLCHVYPSILLDQFQFLTPRQPLDGGLPPHGGGFVRQLLLIRQCYRRAAAGVFRSLPALMHRQPPGHVVRVPSVQGTVSTTEHIDEPAQASTLSRIWMGLSIPHPRGKGKVSA